MKTALGLIQLQDLRQVPSLSQSDPFTQGKKDLASPINQREQTGLQEAGFGLSCRNAMAKGRRGHTDTITCWAPQNACAETHPLQRHGARKPYHEDEVPELGVWGTSQTWADSATNSIPTLAAGTQGTVKWIPTLGLRHCHEVSLVAGSWVTHLLLSV